MTGAAHLVAAAHRSRGRLGAGVLDDRWTRRGILRDVHGAPTDDCPSACACAQLRQSHSYRHKAPVPGRSGSCPRRSEVLHRCFGYGQHMQRIGLSSSALTMIAPVWGCSGGSARTCVPYQDKAGEAVKGNGFDLEGLGVRRPNRAAPRGSDSVDRFAAAMSAEKRSVALPILAAAEEKRTEFSCTF